MKHLRYFNEAKGNKPNIKKVEFSGFSMLYGRDAQSNDILTFEIANDEDIWMHAKGVPGSHVVIKVDEKLPTEEILKHAAEIAAKNCKSTSEDVEVVVCKRKFVKKEPQMNPGQVKVDYKNSETIKVKK